MQPNSLKLIFFWITLTAELLSAAGVLYSRLAPNQRIWPPPGATSWQARLMWLLFLLSSLGMAGTGILDWGSQALPGWLRLALGLPLWLGGIALGIWALWALKIPASLGSQSGLLRRSPYAHSRNPQYLGFIAALLGWGVVTSSSLALLAGMAGCLALILAPFAEEPWLQSLYGDEYLSYMQTTPRFIPRIKRLY